MLYIKNHSHVLILVIHEIYGINNHIRAVGDKLAAEKFDVLCPNLLYPKQSFRYDEEAVAYQNFMQKVGFNLAQQQIENLLIQFGGNYKYRFVIGYSVGATIAWLCSQRKGLCDGVIGFYGSRIRDYKNIEPKCPILLFFPSKEESFNVDSLIEELTDKSRISIIKVNALHGFADPWSGRFCAEVSEQTFRRTRDFIDSIMNLNGLKFS